MRGLGAAPILKDCVQCVPPSPSRLQPFDAISFQCTGTISTEVYTDIDDIPLRFIASDGGVALCGPDLSPLPPAVNADPTRDDSLYSSDNLESNVTSSRCMSESSVDVGVTCQNSLASCS